MTKNATQSLGKSGKHAHGVVLGVHDAGGTLRVVALRSLGGEARVLEARSFSGGMGAWASARSMAESHKAGLIVRVAPLTQCVARVGATPQAGASAGQSAATLLAEAELPPDVQAHRRGGAAIFAGASEGNVPVLCTAWLGGAKSVAGAGAEKEPCEVRWCTAHGALAGLAQVCAQKRCAGVVAGSHAGSRASSNAGKGGVAGGIVGGAAMLCVQEAGVSARTIVWRGEGSLAGHAEEVGDAVAELCHGVMSDGDADDFARACEAWLPSVQSEQVLLRGEVQGVAGVPAGNPREWLSDYGVALGAAACALSAELSPLAMLLEHKPKEVVPVPVRVARVLRKPGVIAAAAVIAGAAVLLGPWGLTKVRAQTLDVKAKQLTNAKDKTKDLGLQAVVYEQLEEQRLPMSKILADVAGVTPVGVTLEDIRLTNEQGLVVRGTATSRDLVNTLEQSLSATRLFRDVKQSSTKSTDSGGAQFEISARVESAHIAVKPAEDFGAQPLAVRLYGEGASNTTMPVGAKREVVKSRAKAGDAGDTINLSQRGAPTGDAPAALTDAEIAAMDRSTAMRGWAARRSYLNKNQRLEESVKTRLEGEVTKLKDRMDKAGSSGGGGK